MKVITKLLAVVFDWVSSTEQSQILSNVLHIYSFNLIGISV